MKKTRHIFESILFVLCCSTLFAQVKQNKPASLPSRKIMEVKSVALTLNKKNPAELIVKAKGEVNVAGWTKGKLKPRFSSSKPAINGIYRFDFIAIPPDPSLNVTQVVSPISATYTFKTIPEDLIRVVVFSENNKVKKHYK